MFYVIVIAGYAGVAVLRNGNVLGFGWGGVWCGSIDSESNHQSRNEGTRSSNTPMGEAAQEANATKAKFYQMAVFPNVIGCVDGTHVRILAPIENEHEYVNRKNFHSINVQVMTTVYI